MFYLHFRHDPTTPTHQGKEHTIMLDFAQIDAAVMAVHEDPETDSQIEALLRNEQFTSKLISTSVAMSKDTLLDALMSGETDQAKIGGAVFQTTVLSIAITMLLAGRILERTQSASIAALVEGFGEE